MPCLSSAFRNPPMQWTSDHLYEYVVKRKKRPLGIDQCSWENLKLPTSEYNKLKGRIQQEKNLPYFFDESVAFDYDSENDRFTLRCPDLIQVYFNKYLKIELSLQIDRLKRSVPALHHITVAKGATVNLAQNVEDEEDTVEGEGRGRANGIHDKQPTLLRQPDLTCRYGKNELPLLVVEVAIHNKSDDLQELAESYILDSKHEIRRVIGIDLGYIYSKHHVACSHHKQPTVSIWAPGTRIDETGKAMGLCIKEVDRQPFRDETGKPLDGSIDIPLSCLMPGGVAALHGQRHDHTINISFTQLSGWLDLAKAMVPINVDASVPRPTRWQSKTRVRDDAPISRRPIKRERRDE